MVPAWIKRIFGGCRSGTPFCDQTVQTGSFNYSFSAKSKNTENVVVLWNAVDTANRFAAQFQEIWQRASPL
ncbi:phospholipase D-like domain-containing protein (plasmid) [Rhizobium sp. CB3171]|nr:phospholipase D-like domain-containing protein [Rhizobium sp. CB3171]WFU07285.1 phospholipase D-like domain-containing protein [Rhizobium sp. CB3171]